MKQIKLKTGSTEKGIPVPPPRGGKGAISPLKERIVELEVGESFYVEFPPDDGSGTKQKIVNHINMTIYRMKLVKARTYAGRRFTTRQWQTEATEDSPATQGCRIWRIEDRNT